MHNSLAYFLCIIHRDSCIIVTFSYKEPFALQFLLYRFSLTAAGELFINN